MEQCYKHFDQKERTLMYWWRKEKLAPVFDGADTILRGMQNKRWAADQCQHGTNIDFHTHFKHLGGIALARARSEKFSQPVTKFLIIYQRWRDFCNREWTTPFVLDFY